MYTFGCIFVYGERMTRVNIQYSLEVEEIPDEVSTAVSQAVHKKLESALKVR